MSHPKIHSAICGNQYFHVMTFAAAGDYIPTHAHTYDHVMQVISGRLRLVSGSETVDVGAGDYYDVPAGIEHGMMAMEPHTVAQCIHILRRDDGSVVPFAYKLSAKERLELTGAL